MGVWDVVKSWKDVDPEGFEWVQVCFSPGGVLQTCVMCWLSEPEAGAGSSQCTVPHNGQHLSWCCTPVLYALACKHAFWMTLCAAELLMFFPSEQRENSEPGKPWRMGRCCFVGVSWCTSPASWANTDQTAGKSWYLTCSQRWCFQAEAQLSKASCVDGPDKGLG